MILIAEEEESYVEGVVVDEVGMRDEREEKKEEEGKRIGG